MRSDASLVPPEPRCPNPQTRRKSCPPPRRSGTLAHPEVPQSRRGQSLQALVPHQRGPKRAGAIVRIPLPKVMTEMRRRPPDSSTAEMVRRPVTAEMDDRQAPHHGGHGMPAATPRARPASAAMTVGG